MPPDCQRCAVLEDLLGSAHIQIERERREAEKADDEVTELKVNALRIRSLESKQDYALIKKFQRRAEAAEAALEEYKALYNVI